MKYLRWALVLPGALLGGILATFPLHWLLYFGFAHENATLFGIIEFPNGLDIEPIEFLIYPAVISAAYIIIGSQIAPNHKIKTALALFVIYLIFWLIANVYFHIAGNSINAQSSGRTLLALLGAVVGLAIVKFSKNETTSDQKYFG